MVTKYLGVGLKQRRNDAKIEGLFFTTEVREASLNE